MPRLHLLAVLSTSMPNREPLSIRLKISRVRVTLNAISIDSRGSMKPDPKVDVEEKELENIDSMKSNFIEKANADMIDPVDVKGLMDLIGPEQETANAKFSLSKNNSSTECTSGESIDSPTILFESSQDATQDFVVDTDQTLAFKPSTLKLPGGSRATIPKKIGDFAIQKVLGRGGMGIVYKAFHETLKRTVALKMILSGEHASREQLERFISEAKAVAHLQHPNIVQIFDIGEHESLPFFSLEFVDGDSLDKRLAGKPLSSIEAAELMETVSRAMQYAHDHGILHRDLKPANILLTQEGVPKVTDFGLAKSMEDSDDSSTTRTGTIMGTPSYMSPEQARGSIRELGPATDQYSLGAMLYEFLTGRPPFLAAEAFDTVMQVINDEPLPPRTLQPKLAADLETICLKALQKESEKRYVSCAAFADDLARFVRGEPIVARPVGNFERSWRWCKRNPIIAGLSAAALLSMCTVAIVSTWSAFTLSRKNAELDLSVEALNQSNQSLVKTNEDLVALGEENKRRSTRLQDFVQEVFRQTRLLDVRESPKAKDYKEEMLLKSLPLIDEIRTELPKGGQSEATMMFALAELGNSYADQYKTTEAEKARAMVVDMARGRVIVKEGSDKSRANLVNGLIALSDCRMELSRNLTESLHLLQEALAIAQSALDQPKASSDGLGMNATYISKAVVANCNIKIGTLLYRVGKSKDAIPYYQKSLELNQEILPTLLDGTAYENIPLTTEKLTEAGKQAFLNVTREVICTIKLALATATFRSSRTDEAQKLFNQLIEENKNEFMNPSESPTQIRRVVGFLGNWGEYLTQSGSLEKGLLALKRAAELSDKLLELNNENAAFNRAAAIAYHRYAQWLPANDPDRIQFGMKGLEILKGMVKAEPLNDRNQITLMLSMSRFGEIAAAESIADRFLNSKSRDGEMLLEVGQSMAQCSLRAEGEAADRLSAKGIAAIQNAIQLGFTDNFLLEKDVDLAPLRSLAAFQALLR